MEQWCAGGDPDTACGPFAADLQLDRVAFTACLMSRKALERVLRDLYDAQGIGVRSMPTFILVHGGTGHVLTSARSTEQFVGTLRKQFERAKSAATAAGSSANP
jgi:predicted DsbA family dithiol-disulfide isomerase